MVFEHEILSMPFNQIMSVMKILEVIANMEKSPYSENSEYPYVILTFDEPFGSAIRIGYNMKTKKVQISCTEPYYKQNISTKE